MLNYLLSPEFQIVNTAGKPCTGYLEVYISGSRERYYCASDFDGTLYPFQVPLDSLGSNVVLADDSHAYDVYIYNRYGSLLMSRYNVHPGAGGGSIGTGDITSSDGSIIVTQTANGVDLRTNSTPPSILRATASTLYTDGQFTFSEAQRDGQNAIVDAQGKIIVNEGWWHYDATVRLRWTGPAQNETQSVSLYTQNASDSMTFDMSYAHSETVQVSGEYKALNDSTQFILGVTNVPSGMVVDLVDFGVHSIIGEGAGGKYTAGEGIVIDEPNRVISVDFDTVQGKLTAGTGISIDENNVISVTEDLDNDFVTLSPVVAPSDGSGLFIQAGLGLREREMDYKYYELPAIQVAGSETESTYIVAAPWKFRTQYDINTNTSVSNMSAVGFFLYANVPGGSANLANCVVEWSVDKNHTAYLRSKTLVVPTYTSETPYVPCNAQDFKRGGYFFTFQVPSSAFIDKMLEDDRFDAGGDWSGYSGARGTMYFALYNTVTHQYMSLPKTDGEKMAVQKMYNLQIDYTKVQPRLTAGSNITIVDNVISATAEPQVQADWDQSDTTAVDYIKNKPTVDQTYDSTSANAQSGTAVAEALATIDTADFFVATYNVTTFADILAAYNAGKTIVCTETEGPLDGRTIKYANCYYIGTYNDQAKRFAFDRVGSDDGALLSSWYYECDLDRGWRKVEFSTQPYTSAEKTKLSGIEAGAEVNVQADWSQTDSNADDYIKNKPANLVQDADYHHTDNNYTDADVAKLAGIATGAEVNVQSNWTEADTTADSYIQNKPTPTSLVAGANINIVDDAQNNTVTISAASVSVPVQDVTIDNVSVVNAQGVAEIPRQQNADWNSSAGASEILNKPSIPVIGTITL